VYLAVLTVLAYLVLTVFAAGALRVIIAPNGAVKTAMSPELVAAALASSSSSLNSHAANTSNVSLSITDA
jgi:ABC-type uncharacterized transport system ATPase subunit